MTDDTQTRPQAVAATHTPGPWIWYGSTDHYPRFHLATERHGRRFVMGFVRAGMQSAEPIFQINGRMVKASELVRYDVDRSVKGVTAAKGAESVYRQDFSEIDHPDARLIASAPELLEAVEALLPADWRDGVMDHLPGVKIARLALAKATGQ